MKKIKFPICWAEDPNRIKHFIRYHEGRISIRYITTILSYDTDLKETDAVELLALAVAGKPLGDTAKIIEGILK